MDPTPKKSVNDFRKTNLSVPISRFGANLSSYSSQSPIKTTPVAPKISRNILSPPTPSRKHPEIFSTVPKHAIPFPSMPQPPILSRKHPRHSMPLHAIPCRSIPLSRFMPLRNIPRTFSFPPSFRARPAACRLSKRNGPSPAGLAAIWTNGIPADSRPES